MTGPAPALGVAPWHGSSSSDEHGRWGEFALWLHPLPPPGPLTLTWEWPEHDVARSTVELDGTALVAAAGETRPLRGRPTRS